MKIYLTGVLKRTYVQEINGSFGKGRFSKTALSQCKSLLDRLTFGGLPETNFLVDLYVRVHIQNPHFTKELPEFIGAKKFFVVCNVVYFSRIFFARGNQIRISFS